MAESVLMRTGSREVRIPTEIRKCKRPATQNGFSEKR